MPVSREHGKFMVVSGYVVAAHGQMAESEFKENVCITDMFWGAKDVPTTGIWVWEGVVRCVTMDLEADITFHGEWRRPTPDEWMALLTGRHPWSGELRKLGNHVVARRGRDYPCEKCGRLKGSTLSNGWYRCNGCGYPGQ